MAQTNTQKLDAGDRFPTMTMTLIGGQSLSLPDDLTHDYTVLLIYRGKW